MSATTVAQEGTTNVLVLGLGGVLKGSEVVECPECAGSSPLKKMA